MSYLGSNYALPPVKQECRTKTIFEFHVRTLTPPRAKPLLSHLSQSIPAISRLVSGRLSHHVRSGAEGRTTCVILPPTTKITSFFLKGIRKTLPLCWIKIYSSNLHKTWPKETFGFWTKSIFYPVTISCNILKKIFAKRVTQSAVCSVQFNHM